MRLYRAWSGHVTKRSTGLTLHIAHAQRQILFVLTAYWPFYLISYSISIRFELVSMGSPPGARGVVLSKGLWVPKSLGLKVTSTKKQQLKTRQIWHTIFSMDQNSRWKKAFPWEIYCQWSQRWVIANGTLIVWLGEHLFWGTLSWVGKHNV